MLQAPRNRTFDFLRLVFATAVIFAHAPALAYGDPATEMLHHFTRGNLDLGIIAVDGFFLLSGYLIVKSWVDHPQLGYYLLKRVLRIVPGYLVAALLTTLLAGAFVPHPAEFFAGLGRPFWFSLLWLKVPNAPPVWLSNPRFHIVNGSMWTIIYEFRCYLLVAVCGLLGVLRRRWLWLAATVMLLVFACLPGTADRFSWHPATGDPRFLLQLVPPFFVGGCFYFFRGALQSIRCDSRACCAPIPHACLLLGCWSYRCAWRLSPLLCRHAGH